MNPSNEIHVLDKGFVRLVDLLGDDSAIVQAARVSYGAGTKSTREDAALIDYLMGHHHTSPFEMVVFRFHVKLPIFIARQWIRHRTASLNETSYRYSIAKDEFYIPDEYRVLAQDVKNKQGSAGTLNDEVTHRFTESLAYDSERAFGTYQESINAGIARETARIGLPLGTYTEMYWQMDLHNLFHFLKLRLDSHAQYEIQQYAQAIADLIKPIVPVSYAAFENHRLHAITLSADEMAILRASLDTHMTRERIERSDLRESRQRELLAKLGLDNA